MKLFREQLNPNRKYKLLIHRSRQVSSIFIRSNRAEDQVAPYPVAIAPEMVSRLEDCLQQLNSVPVQIRGGGDNTQNTEQSLLVIITLKTL